MNPILSHCQKTFNSNWRPERKRHEDIFREIIFEDKVPILYSKGKCAGYIEKFFEEANRFAYVKNEPSYGGEFRR